VLLVHSEETLQVDEQNSLPLSNRWFEEPAPHLVINSSVQYSVEVLPGPANTWLLFPNYGTVLVESELGCAKISKKGMYNARRHTGACTLCLRLHTDLHTTMHVCDRIFPLKQADIFRHMLRGGMCAESVFALQRGAGAGVMNLVLASLIWVPLLSNRCSRTFATTFTIVSQRFR
jgi:hypothetical protein